MAYKAAAYVTTAVIVIGYVDMACVVTAYIAMALCSYGLCSYASGERSPGLALRLLSALVTGVHSNDGTESL